MISQVRHYLETGAECPLRSLFAKIKGAIHHLELTTSLKGEEAGVLEMRKQPGLVSQRMKHTAPVKESDFSGEKEGELLRILQEYLDGEG